MVDVTWDTVTPAVSADLLSLGTAKVMLGITDTSEDELLSLLISQSSDMVAEECNRVFARETGIETWRCLEDINCPPGMSRLYLTHYPVKKSDLAQVALLDGTLVDPADYYLEERSGKLTLKFVISDVQVSYTGGYLLPDEAPTALQQAIGLLVQKGRQLKQTAAATSGGAGSAQASGIRMISHKGARIMYYSPKDLAAASGGTGGAASTGKAGDATDSAVKNLLYNYIRYWV